MLHHQVHIAIATAPNIGDNTVVIDQFTCYKAVAFNAADITRFIVMLVNTTIRHHVFSRGYPLLSLNSRSRRTHPVPGGGMKATPLALPSEQHITAFRAKNKNRRT